MGRVIRAVRRCPWAQGKWCAYPGAERTELTSLHCFSLSSKGARLSDLRH